MAIIAALLVLIGLLSGHGPRASAAALLTPGGSAPVGSVDLALPQDWDASAPAARVSGPLLSARSAFAVDLTNQVALYAQDADQPLAPGSTAKMITALVAAGAVDDLDSVVEIEPSDLVDPAIYSHMGLQAGDRVSVRDLLAGALIPSGGDAARALGRYVGRLLGPAPGQEPRARFVDEMNRLAASLGMRHSHFTNVDGTDAPGQVVTARDLAIAAEALFRDQTLARLVGLRSLTVAVGGPNARQITLWNTNEMLGESGVDGVKTGTTDAAGQCLVLATRRSDARIVTVVLGSQDRYADTRALLAHLDQQYAWVRIGRGAGLPGLAAELRQDGLQMMTGRTVVLTRGEADTLAYSLRLNSAASAPARSPWRPRGEVVFTAGGEPLLRLPLYALSQVEG